MVSPSSTSSSSDALIRKRRAYGAEHERRSAAAVTKLPMAGVLALCAVIGVDLALSSLRWPWLSLGQMVEGAIPRGIVRDQFELMGLASTPPDQLRAVVVGSSRANAGFSSRHVPHQYAARIKFGKVAHAAIGVFEINSFVSEAIDRRADAVVMLLSEFDLNRPVRANVMTSFGSFAAVRDLAVELGAESTFEHRHVLYRLSTAALLNSYRFRRVFQSAFVDDLRRFDFDGRFPSTTPHGFSRPLVPGGIRRALSTEDQQAINTAIGTAFPHLSDHARKLVFRQLHQITRGLHVEVNQGLLLKAIDRLTESGAVAVIVEAPLHPIAARIYDSAIRDEFVKIAETLDRRPHVRFVSIESSGPYSRLDFRDPTHLGPTGTQKLTRAASQAVYEMVVGPAGENPTLPPRSPK